jgi:zinc protease
MLSNNRDIANLLLRINFYHLPQNFINNYVANIRAVSAKDIKKALQKQIKPDTLLQVRVG